MARVVYSSRGDSSNAGSPSGSSYDGIHLSLKRFCLVPPRMSLEDYSRHTCDDHSHSHLSKAQVYELQSHGAIEWLRGSLSSSTPKLKGVLRIRRYFAARGLSCSVGGVLVHALARKEDWAQAMYGQINPRSRSRQESESERPLCYA